MIIIENLSKNYGDFNVLKNINIHIYEGEIYGLVGKSGAGKSTLLRCINGLEGFKTGNISVHGQSIKMLSKNQLREYRKNISMIFQHFALLSRKTVFDNIAFPMKCWGYDTKTIESRVLDLSRLVGIEDKLNERPANLSGGQKQRVAIARALTTNPKVLLCDEATSALDPVTTNAILNLLKDINSKLGITIVVVTHQMVVIKSVCQRISLLDNGSITITDNAENLFLKQPEAFKEFLGKEQTITPETGTTLRIAYISSQENNLIISKIIKQLHADVAILNTETSKYRDRFLNEMIINFDSKFYKSVVDILSTNDIYWEECH